MMRWQPRAMQSSSSNEPMSAALLRETDLQSNATFADASASAISDTAAEERICRTLMWHILPVLMFAYVAAYIDRVNVSFMRLQLANQLGFSDVVFGFGAGTFLLGFVVFEVPSNMILQRVGARHWLTRIIVSWGLLTALTTLISTPRQFYAMRYLLGIAEAGLVPGIIYYISHSFPRRHRGRVISTFYVALPLAGVIGSPLAGLVMHYLDGALNIAGWRWMLIVDSVPAFIAALLCWWRLEDNVIDSPRYDAVDRGLLAHALARDGKMSLPIASGAVYSSGLVWAFCTIFFLDGFACYGYALWAPTIIHSLGVDGNLRVGLLTALPNVVAIVAIILVGRNVDRIGERRLHVAALMFLAALGLTMSALLHHSVGLSVFALCIAAAGLLSVLAIFWSMPTAVLAPAAAAGGIGLISAVGNLGGFFGTYTVGYLKQSSGSPMVPVAAMVGCLLLGSILTLLLPKHLVNS
nr:MFS transporter [Paraburkholderia tropica]